jgi:hypothetical protein
MKKPMTALVVLSFCALFSLLPAANAQTVNGNIDAAFAVGKWKESHEGVSLFCARVTTQGATARSSSLASNSSAIHIFICRAACSWVEVFEISL